MEPRLISLVINMAVNSTQRLQIFPSVYHFSHCEFNVLSELVIFGGVSQFSKHYVTVTSSHSPFTITISRKVWLGKNLSCFADVKKMGTGDILLGVTL